jgi:peptidyl-prolyl cis-trans isomerase SurA
MAQPTAGSAIAPVNGTTEISSTSDPDPLAPKPVLTGKTRFSSRAPEEKVRKASLKQAKVTEKVAATPVAASTDEAATRKQQSGPLGLNGDTATKKKVKRKKGEAKERLQGKPKVDPATATPPIAPTVNPALGANPGGTTSPPQTSPTTLPPASAPAPGAPPGGQPLAPNGAPATTPNGTAAPLP